MVIDSNFGGDNEMDVTTGKEIVLKAGNDLLSRGLVAGTWGNISLKINKDQMVVTPSGMNYENLTINDMVVMDINTHKYEGDVKPSSESKLHAALYRQRDDINAIIHTHSLYASTVAATRQNLPLEGSSYESLIGIFVPVTRYAISSTPSLERNVLIAIGDNNAVLLANHGAFCIGDTMDETFIICDKLEEACKKFIDGTPLLDEEVDIYEE